MYQRVKYVVIFFLFRSFDLLSSFLIVFSTRLVLNPGIYIRRSHLSF